MQRRRCPFFFFFNDTATTEIYTLSLHDALPIFSATINTTEACTWRNYNANIKQVTIALIDDSPNYRSEEHTSELQSQSNLVCRLLLEKKKQNQCSGTDGYCREWRIRAGRCAI